MKPLSILATVAVALSPVAVSACGSDAPPEPRASAPAVGARALAAPAAASAALSKVADVHAARMRLGYVDLVRLRATELPPVSWRQVVERVLGRGAQRLARLGPAAAHTAIQVGEEATILHGPALRRSGGRRRGPDGLILGAGPALAARLAETRPETSAITPVAQSAVQSCLGAALAQTIIGPETMGRDAALGVGIATSGDPPAGVQLRICGAPHLIRHVHAMKRRLERRFGSLPGGPSRQSRIGEHEIGEREIVAATVAADALTPAQLLRLLNGGDDLRALSWR